MSTHIPKRISVENTRICCQLSVCLMLEKFCISPALGHYLFFLWDLACSFFCTNPFSQEFIIESFNCKTRSEESSSTNRTFYGSSVQNITNRILTYRNFCRNVIKICKLFHFIESKWGCRLISGFDTWEIHPLGEFQMQTLRNKPLQLFPNFFGLLMQSSYRRLFFFLANYEKLMFLSAQHGWMVTCSSCNY